MSAPLGPAAGAWTAWRGRRHGTLQTALVHAHEVRRGTVLLADASEDAYLVIGGVFEFYLKDVANLGRELSAAAGLVRHVDVPGLSSVDRVAAGLAERVALTAESFGDRARQLATDPDFGQIMEPEDRQARAQAVFDALEDFEVRAARPGPVGRLTGWRPFGRQPIRRLLRQAEDRKRLGDR